MAETAVSSAAKWIWQLLEDEAKYLDKVSEKVEVLQSELEWMQCFLRDADEKRHTQAVVQKWVSQIKEHAFDAEDIIENYLLKVTPQSKHIIERLFSKKTILRYLCICRDAIALHGIGSEIDTLTDKITKLTQRLQTYGVIIKDNSPYNSRPLQRTYSFQKNEKIVGMKEDIKTLKSSLLSNNNIDTHKVIAVCGMGGLGKTTIVRKLYQDKDVRSHFDTFGWVHMSQNFNADGILQTIKDELTSKMDEGMKQQFKGTVRQVLFELMTKMKCLVVVDDAWTSDDFELLRVAFPIENEECASKVILTTRNDKTTQGLNSDLVFLHKLKGLEEDEAFELFKNKAFPDTQTCPVLLPGELKDLTNEMLKHCRGVPLAIITLAAVLKTKRPRKEEWEAVRNNISLHLRKGKDQNLPYKNVHDVLSMSYDNLQSHLRICFLYLATFPEDYEIETENLFQLWIADGIVASANIYGEQLKGEEVAEIYFNELVSKNMVEVCQRSPNGKIKKFVLHDLMRDMCVAKAKEESFLHSNKQPTQQVSASSNDLSPASRFDQKVRRLVVNVDREANMSILSSSSATRSRIRCVRSLVFFRTGDICGKDEDCTTLVINISKDFPLLRVLDFEQYSVKGNLPKEVGNMIHLRYLRLKGTYIDRLPTSIGELHLLQTLDLRVRSDKISLPNILWKLKLLKHLYLPNFYGLEVQVSNGYNKPTYDVRGGEKLRLDGSRHLETLMNVDLDRTSVQGVNIANIKRFWACVTKKESLDPFLGSEMKEMEEMSLRIHPQIIIENPTMLSCESLKSAQIHSAADEKVLFPPLEEKMFHHHLDTLHIWYCTLQADPMSVLEKLENLTTLGLHVCYDGDELRCKKGGFPKLSFLFLDILPNLLELNVEEGTLLSLKNITIWDCPLRIIPTTIPSSVSILCGLNCIPGSEKYGHCPYAKTRTADEVAERYRLHSSSELNKRR